MRTWRVGTFSMGLTLIMLGVFLLASQLLGFNTMHVMMSWWPLILVVLGAEILIFLLKSKDEQPFLKYDFLSILFVGVLGTVGICFALLQTTGLIDKAEDYLMKEYKTYDLPELSYDISDDIKRIVVDSGPQSLIVEGTSSNEVAMFGTYEAYTNKKEKLLKDAADYVQVHKNGETVYINIKNNPIGDDYFGNRTNMSPVLIVPQNVTLEVNGNYNDLTLKPRTLMSNWTIDRASTVSVQLQDKSDVKVVADSVQHIEGKLDGWSIEGTKKQNVNKDEQYDEFDEGNSAEELYDSDDLIKKATYKHGKGTNVIQLPNVEYISLKVIN